VVWALVTAAAFGGAYLVLALAGLVGTGNAYLAAPLGLLLSIDPPTSILAGAFTPYLLGPPPPSPCAPGASNAAAGSRGGLPDCRAVLAKVLLP